MSVGGWGGGERGGGGEGRDGRVGGAAERVYFLLSHTEWRKTLFRSCVRVEVAVLGCPSSGFRGCKDLLNRALALVTTCP